MDKAKEIAMVLINKKIAKCVNIIPRCISLYEWQDKICEDEELVLIIKSSKVKFAELEMVIKRLHPYQLPEIICFNIDSGNTEYLNWLNI